MRISLGNVVLTGTGSAFLLVPALSGQAVAVPAASGHDAPMATVRSAESPRPQAAFTEPTLHFGDHGTTVKQMQQRLKGLGYDPGTIDGKWGDATSFAVWAFQKVNHIKPGSNCGTKTWAALVHPASHGCVRIPMSTSNIVAKLLPLGTRVYVRG